MSFMFGGAAPQPSSAQKLAAAEAELEMFTDMFNRLTHSCFKKCIPTDYRDGDLNKGESVCVDRCVAKFFDVNIKISERIQQQNQMKAGQTPGAGAGLPGGFGGH